MFGFLKDKLKSALSVFSNKADETSEEVTSEEILEVEEEKKDGSEKKKPVEKKDVKKEIKKREKKQEKTVEKKEEKEPEKKEEVPKVEEKSVWEKKETFVDGEEKGFFAKIKEKFVSPKEEIKEEVKEEIKKESRKEERKEEKFVEELPAEKVEEKKGWFGVIKEKITTKIISADKFDELFWDLELVLLENNVAVDVIGKIKNDLKSALVDKPLPRAKIEDAVAEALKNSVLALFEFPSFDLASVAKKHKPFVICLAGVNGSGKTTTIAKLAYLLQKNGLSCVIAAADTFRAAAIDQLQLHADKLNVKLIRQDYGSDAAAVAFDAVKHASAKNKDVVLIDTAGRLHSNVNLMDEMKKIIRVAKPHLKLFIGESITGNDCVEQARLFDEVIGIDGIILSKADIDEKGGAALSVSYITKKPILYFGTGQEYDDLELFDKDKMIRRIGL